MRYSPDAIAGQLQNGVPLAIPLERMASVMEGVSVEFDNELSLPPCEINLEPLYERIDCRFGDPRRPAEPGGLGLRPSRWCKLGDSHQHRRSGRGQRGEGRFITGSHAGHRFQRQVTVL